MKEVKIIHNIIRANEVNFTSTIELEKPKTLKQSFCVKATGKRIFNDGKIFEYQPEKIKFVELYGYYNIQDGSFEIQYWTKSGRIYAYQFAELLGLTLGDQLDDFEKFVIESLDFDIKTPDSPSQEIWRLPKNLIQNT